MRFGSIFAVCIAILIMYIPDIIKLPSALWLLSYDKEGKSPHLYDALCVLQRVALPRLEITCMNHGWSSSVQNTQTNILSNSRERVCLQMYDVVVQAAIHQSFDETAHNDIGLRGLDIVEVGCGRGGGANFVYAHYQPRSMIAIDASHEQISGARRLHSTPNGGVKFVRGDALQLPVTNQSADVVINIESLQHYSNPAAFYKEVLRILRVGGIFVIADFMYALSSLSADPSLWSASSSEPKLQLLSEVDISRGVARAISDNQFWSEIVGQIPQWVYTVIPGFYQMLESFMALPNGYKHRAFRTGRLRYKLAIFTKK